MFYHSRKKKGFFEEIVNKIFFPFPDPKGHLAYHLAYQILAQPCSLETYSQKLEN